MFVLTAGAALGAVISPDLKANPKITNDESLIGPVIPYHHLGGRQSPGDSIGITYGDAQAFGSYGQRLFVDDRSQAHIDWKKDFTGNQRVVWNFRYTNGTYFGEVDASPMTASYAQLDVTQDANPDSQRSMITYYYNPGSGLYSWIDVDQGNGYGIFPGNPMPWPMDGYVWPHIAVASNNNVVMITGDSNEDILHAGLTPDLGYNWTLVADIDSVMTLSQFARSSRNSSKVVLAWTQSIALEYAGYLISQMANNVYYILSTDNGMTWGMPVNITNYLPPGQMVNGDTTPWAFCDVNAVFDSNDNLHIAWTTNMGWMQNDTIYFGDRSKIFHWEEISDTITTVNSPSRYYYEPGGWWLSGSAGDPGAWRLACDNPQLVDGPADAIYCLWHGNDDTTDVSAAGWVNGEFYGSYSTDDGLTWSDYVNLTNTRGPGAPPGTCHSEISMTANPFVVNDSIYITYIEDRDAGAYAQGEGVMTLNIVRCWVFPKSLIQGVEENTRRSAPDVLPFLAVYPNPFSNKTNIRCMIHDAGCTINDHQSSMQNAGYMKHDKRNAALKIFDASGRLVKSFNPLTNNSFNQITWSGTDDSGCRLPAGVYFVRLVASTIGETEWEEEIEKAILIR